MVLKPAAAVGAAAAVGDGGYTTLRALLDWLAR